MKNKISAIILTAFLALPVSISAVESCFQNAALSYAVAAYNYQVDKAYCEDALFPGPCKDEAEAKHNFALETIASTFELCCCTSSVRLRNLKSGIVN